MSFIKRNLSKIIIAAVFVIGIIFASFYDLEISKKLVDLADGKYFSSNLLGRFFETVGIIPVYYLVAFSSSIIFQNFYRRKNKKYAIYLMIFAVITSVIITTLMFKKMFGYMGDHYGFKDQLGGVIDFFAYLVLGVVLTGLTFWLSFKFSVDFLNKALIWAVVVMLTAALCETVTHVIKPISGRVRYRAMNVVGDFSYYTPWYKFNGGSSKEAFIEINAILSLVGIGSDAFKSFPSGHSTAIAMLAVLTALPNLTSKLAGTKARIALYSLIAIIVAFGMYARILVGAHFLSDVLFGCGITLLCYMLSNYLVNLLFKKYVTLQPLTQTKRNLKLVEEAIQL